MPASGPNGAGSEMFAEFYGLHEDPFNLFTQRYLYLGVSHRKALSSLQYGIEYGSGLQVLLGAAGLGKTALLRYLEARYEADNRIIYLASALAKDPALLKRLGASGQGQESGNGRVGCQPIADNKPSDRQTHQRLVLLVDDAHELNQEELTRILALAKLNESKEGLAIILAGRPELDGELKQANPPDKLRQISIAPLNEVETAEYINHRLKMAAGRRGSIFTQAACAVIAKQSEGVPRAINRICIEALLDGAERQHKIIDASALETKELGQARGTARVKHVMAGLVAPSLRKGKAHRAPLILALLLLTGAAAFWHQESYQLLRAVIVAINGTSPAIERPPTSRVAQSAPAAPKKGINSELPRTIQSSGPSTAPAKQPSSVPSNVIVRQPPPMKPVDNRRHSLAESHGSVSRSNEASAAPRGTANARVLTRETEFKSSTPVGVPPSEVKSTESNAELDEASNPSSQALRAANAHQARVDAEVGDDYMRLGRYERAIEFYKDALLLEPGDKSVEKKIQQARVEAADE
jgi:general secretion pathway protein A